MSKYNIHAEEYTNQNYTAWYISIKRRNRPTNLPHENFQPPSFPKDILFELPMIWIHFACFWTVYKWNHTVCTILCLVILLQYLFSKFTQFFSCNWGLFILMALLCFTELVIYCYKVNYPQISKLKETNIYYITVSVCQESRQNLAE